MPVRMHVDVFIWSLLKDLNVRPEYLGAQIAV